MSRKTKRKVLRTSDIAKDLGVHVNTVRLYEENGYLPEIPRGENGYRQYNAMHLEQARLTHLVMRWPYLGDKALLINLVQSAAMGDLGGAMEMAYHYLANVRVERTYAEAAVEFLEHWAAGHLMETPQQRVYISEAAQRLNVTVDMLRNWERNGLIDVPRDPTNHYRLYGAREFGRLRVIRTLVQAGYSLMAILQMLLQFDAGKRENLRDALTVPPQEDQYIQGVADRWLTTLIELEQRAQAIIRQIAYMIELIHASKNHTG